MSQHYIFFNDLNIYLILLSGTVYFNDANIFVFTGAKSNLDTSTVEKEQKTKTTKKKKQTLKFMSIGKDETVSILHGVGRVLNPKSKNVYLLIYV